MKHSGLVSGFNGLQQYELAVKAAQKMTGYATMSMDPESIEHAYQAIKDANTLYQQMGLDQTGVDQEFLSAQHQLLNQCSHQLEEAEK
ncbi:DUF2564 family protein [Bacillus sp. IB182487]|uniref:DUF2564 family protein n=1 Tax=Metabacillus arenae TaxID=2771434 RepID=A0A926NHW8_9BACI|nr:DUF2564 family protein [Metabacillus arenae]